MPSPPRRPAAGQASAEYVALLALLAVVVTAAAAGAGALDASAIPRAVVAQARLALCLVAGDVCRSADAARAGLEPCVVVERAGAQRWQATGFFLTSADGEGYAIEHRSDGKVAVTSLQSADLGVDVGRDLRIARRRIGVSGRAALEWSTARTWVLHDAPAARRFLARLPRPQVIEDDRDWRFRRLPPPDERFDAGGTVGSLTAGARAGLSLPLVSVSRRRALGRRTTREGTTWYLDAANAGAHLFGGILPAVELERAGGWTLEVTEDGHGRTQRMVIRSVAPGPRTDQETELRAHLDPSLPENAAAARALMALDGTPSPADIARAHLAGRRLQEGGAIERVVHRVTTSESGLNAGVDIGAVGLERSGGTTRRELVSAEVIGPGGRRAVRYDCLAAIR